VIITKFGRMGLDPLQVPEAAAMRPGGTDAFAQQFDAAIAANPDSNTGFPAADASSFEAAFDADQVSSRKSPSSDLDDETDSDVTVASPEYDADTDAPVLMAASEAAAQQTALRKEPLQKDSDPDAAQNAPAGLDNSAAAKAAGAATLASAGQTTATPGAAASAAGVRVDGSCLTGSVAGTSLSASSAVTAKAVATGYRTLNKHSAELTEQARDSVFRQILFKLGKDRGEMRVLLDPPEFGQLDLHMQVENDGRVRLSIGAERADLAALLQQNLEPLKLALQQQGLQVTHAEVHTRTDSDGRRRDSAQHGHRNPSHNFTDEAGAAIAGTGIGYVTANGLDFWA
jgi:flagellar hook-length control protein FliK